MGPVRQNPIQRTVSLFICVCIALCTIAAHNIAQNRPNSFPPYPPDNHHISDDVYLREGGKLSLIVNGTNNVKTFNGECLISSYVKTVHLYLIVTAERSNAVRRLLWQPEYIRLAELISC